jgi:hypothetical protein
MSKSPAHEVKSLNKNTSNPSSIATSPTKKLKNSEMYNRIINLKTKLASYNNNSLQRSSVISTNKEEKQSLSRTFADSSQDNIIQETVGTNINVNANVRGNGKNFTSTINDLKKKWNDVSNKSKLNQSSSVSPMLTPTKINNSNDGSNDQNINRLNEIKNKYNMAKIKK